MSKLNKLEQLKKDIRQAYIDRNYEKARVLQKKLDYFDFGIK